MTLCFLLYPLSFTEIMKLLHLVCEKFDFPSNGRIVDKHNRTPLHIVMITEPTLLSLEVSITVLIVVNLGSLIEVIHKLITSLNIS